MSASLERERIVVARMILRLEDLHRSAAERIARCLRHCTRLRAGSVAGRDEKDQRDRLGHWASLSTVGRCPRKSIGSDSFDKTHGLFSSLSLARSRPASFRRLMPLFGSQ